MLVVKCLCLFACCSCHQGFADAWILLCTLLLPSELCRCLWLKILCLFARCSCHQGFAIAWTICCARCSCHRGFAGACGDKFVFMCTAALAIGALQVLVIVIVCVYLHAALAIGALQVLLVTSLFICMLLLPSGLCRCLWWQVCVYLHAALAIGALQMLEFVVNARSSCHRSFTVLVIKSLYTLLLPSGLCSACSVRVCVYLHAALAIGALQVLVVTSLCLFARCSCHRGFTGAWLVKCLLFCTLLLPSGLCRCL